MENSSTSSLSSETVYLKAFSAQNFEEKEKLRVNVTGSSGLIGSWFCTLNEIPLTQRFDIVTGQDITQLSIRKRIIEDCDVILNLAALSGIKACNDEPRRAKEVNETACYELAKLAKKRGVRRFIQASTSSVYGETSSFKLDETHKTEPRSLYGLTKLRAEKILSLADKNFEVIILRKSNVYGCGMFSKPNTVIDAFLRSYLSKDSMKISGSGDQKRDFLHIMDCVRLYSQISRAERVRSGIYNVGGLETISIKELADLINHIGKHSCGWEVSLEHTDTDGGMTSHNFIYDYSKASMEFNYQPIFSIEEYICEHLFEHLRKK